ncbi:response regulator [Methanoculleus sp. Wushi-C6]|uniref:Response regulator n=1 Tax=Methanoculleus caldifontis TaxID=2651577 RepID=A0ABU3WXU1_9EURY|nr:response regulator [Methanoculleus sp. Wushi-C6]MDV2480612.1 response regulator [Methanoculleus sp. Wushi-C6]
MTGTGEETRILVVEDDGIIALDMVARLEDLGYRSVAVATTGEDAIREAERVRPHLIFMDITLKGSMDGIEAARIIRDRLGLPVVYVTAYSDQSVRSRAEATSPAGYVLKPFTTGDLICAIRHALQPT